MILEFNFISASSEGPDEPVHLHTLARALSILKINLGKRKQKQRPIKLFKKTDWDGFRSEMKAYHQTYLENHSSCDTNTKWTEFKNTLNNLTEKYVPTKMCKPKDGHP